MKTEQQTTVEVARLAVVNRDLGEDLSAGSGAVAVTGEGEVRRGGPPYRSWLLRRRRRSRPDLLQPNLGGSTNTDTRIRCAITVVGIVGHWPSSTRICGSNASATASLMDQSPQSRYAALQETRIWNASLTALWRQWAMLADSRFRSLPLRESQEPVPFGGDQLGADGIDPRLRRSQERWNQMQAKSPLVAAMHPMTPEHIHEELESLDFSSYNFCETEGCQVKMLGAGRPALVVNWPHKGPRCLRSRVLVPDPAHRT
ncbi:hypothetical protein [Rhodococcus globerulus]|uniref:hypothetical protein n=1 Tax=Rhodococcus globerulus TaxID=33008 RepID=UPI003AFB6B97